MATINIYVPDAMKAEMDQVQDANWSQVAREAFQYELLKRKSSPMNIDAVVERIKATRGPGSGRYQEGFSDGQKFAAESADEYQVLTWMAERDCMEFAEPESAMQMVERFTEILQIEADKVFDPRKRRSMAYVEGFIEGFNDLISKVHARL
jgi:hypothetical protein